MNCPLHDNEHLRFNTLSEISHKILSCEYSFGFHINSILIMELNLCWRPLDNHFILSPRMARLRRYRVVTKRNLYLPNSLFWLVFNSYGVTALWITHAKALYKHLLLLLFIIILNLRHSELNKSPAYLILYNYYLAIFHTLHSIKIRSRIWL